MAKIIKKTETTGKAQPRDIVTDVVGKSLVEYAQADLIRIADGIIVPVEEKDKEGKVTGKVTHVTVKVVQKKENYEDIYEDDVLQEFKADDILGKVEVDEKPKDK